MAGEGMYGGMEQRLGQAVYSTQREGSFSDKVLSLKEIDEIKDIIRKNRLDLEDLRQLRYLLSATEIKLLSLDAGERYLLCKFLTWVSSTIQIQETQIKNMEIHKRQENTALTLEIDKMVYEMLDEEVKKMCNTFLSLGRSSLSLDGDAFEKLTSSRFEVQYGGNAPLNQAREASGIMQRIPGWGTK